MVALLPAGPAGGQTAITAASSTQQKTKKESILVTCGCMLLLNLLECLCLAKRAGPITNLTSDTPGI
jgi:hypothetical protein